MNPLQEGKNPIEFGGMLWVYVMVAVLKWVMRSCIGAVSVGRDTVRNAL